MKQPRKVTITLLMGGLFHSLSLSIANTLWAATILICDPSAPVTNQVTSYATSVSEPIPADPNVLRLTSPATHPWDGTVPSGSPSYWKCVDADADGTLERVVEMSQAEKALIDAPALAEQATQQAFTDEISGSTGNDVCSAALSAITTKIDAWVANRQAELDAASNFAQAKAHLRNQLYPELGTVFKRVMRCVRARAR